MSFYLTQALHRGLRHHPQRLATICGERRHSYRQFADRIARCAAALRALGLMPGDRIAMLALNSDRVIEHYLATFWAGGVASPVNIRWSAAEVVHGLRDCGASVLLVDDSFARLASTAAAELPELRHLIHIGDGPLPEGMQSYETLIATHAPVEDLHRHGDDLAFVLYTGGTTGFPKGVMLSHTNFSAAVLGAVAMCGGIGAMHLHAVPLFHMAGLQMLFNALLSGSTHLILPAFNPPAALDLIERERPTDLMLVPTMLQMLVDHPQAAGRDLSSLERVYYGASPISEGALDRAMNALPRASFVQGYGMSETGLTLMLRGEYHTVEGRRLGKLRAAGAAVPAAEIKIVDARGYEAPRGTPGEILVRGPMVMQGYWQQPEQTAKVIQGGWLHTGDVAYMDEDGFVFIVDRLKDMIVSGGENVYSSEVESALSRHPAVAMSAVIGIPSQRWGESVHAVVVLRPGEACTAEQIIEHCRGMIGGYKCPRSVEFRDSLPISAAGKLQKNLLREPYWKDSHRRIG
ncbi:MAG: long-chain-fatty-acid--CoA ligase [Panacagrimonas sp.]